MSIFAISDLHLSLSEDKPMEIFGGNWENYINRLKENWEETVKENDFVLIPGDVSWAMYIKNAYEDFDFLNKLPGTKIISKGNHDYWWETVSKLNNFASENGFDSLRFVHNNTFICEETAICACKGHPADLSNAKKLSPEDAKIYNREVSRFRLSAEMAKKSGKEDIIAMIHYPPAMDSEFVNIMKEFEISVCIYGHLHDRSQRSAIEGNVDGILYKLVACDYMDFMPFRLR